MWKNKRFISVVIVALCVGFVGADSGVAAPIEYEGRFERNEPLAVGMAAGTAENPELVRIEWIRFDTAYANAWRVTARVGWWPVKDATWRLAVELLDAEGRVLRNSRDEPTMFTCKAAGPDQTKVRHVDLDLDAMMDQGRRHAARFRVHLEPWQERDSGAGPTHTLEVAVVDQESQKPIADAAVVVRCSYLTDTFRQDNALYVTDSQGHCRATLPRDGLTVLRLRAQKEGHCTIVKSWSNFGGWPLDRAPLVNLPQRHVLEMVRASSLGGIVQDAEGKAIAGAQVDLTAHLEELSGAVNINRMVRTDANGRWRVDGIPGDVERVTLRVRHAEYGGDNGCNRQLTGDAIVNARALKYVSTLEKGLMMTGRVLDDRGQAVAGATVMLALQFYSPVYALADASGAFRLACSSDRSAYREPPVIIVEAPGYAPIQRIIDLPPKPESLEFRLERGRSITCHVVDTKGQAVVGAWTVVEPLPGNRDYSVWLRDTNDRGEFLIPNVPQGDVKLTIGKQGYVAVRDRVVEPSEDEVVVTMERAQRVRGTVTDATTDKRIPNFEIAAVSTSAGRTRTSNGVAFADGAYEVTFDEAQPETRQLQASAVGYEPATSDQIKTDEGEHVIDFKLTRSASFSKATAGRPREEVQPSGPRRITGVARDEQGKPVPNAIVRVYPRLSSEGVTNAKGVFTLRLRRAPTGSMRREETTYLLARQKERNLAAAVELDPSAETVDVTLVPGAILVGKVVDVDGKGIPKAKLSLTFWTSTIGYGMPENARLDPTGHYEIRAVPPGHRYSVNASAEGYGKRYTRVTTGGAGNERIEVEPLVLSVANLSASGVVIDGLDQPISGIRIYAYGNGQPTRETFTDTNGRFTIENICAGQLNIQANSDRRAPRRLHGRATVKGGATDIRIVVSEMDSRGRPVPTRVPSLVGKPLPELENVGIKLAPADTEGKRILVCFWDVNQRPSRHCMTQIAQQIEMLEQKNVIVVAVQAAKVDQGTLDEWTKKYNIPFSVVAEADAKKLRFSWGVRSLPWLILTDDEHVVRAEGFALTELDDKMEGTH